MGLAWARASIVALAALLMAGCVGGGPAVTPGSSDYLAERDAARRYLVSNVAESAASDATTEIRQAGSEQDRVLISAYLADPAHARQLPAKYQDYLIEMFDTVGIDAMAAETGNGAAFNRQVAMHRFVLAQSLVEWHMAKAGLEGSTVFDDPLVATLVAIIRATPGDLIPESRLQ